MPCVALSITTVGFPLWTSLPTPQVTILHSPSLSYRQMGAQILVSGLVEFCNKTASLIICISPDVRTGLPDNEDTMTDA